MTGFEPATSRPPVQKPSVVSIDNRTLKHDQTSACIPDCTPSTKTSNAGPASNDFSDALKMIASLPLSKAEKAEAVRRLLAVHKGIR